MLQQRAGALKRSGCRWIDLSSPLVIAGLLRRWFTIRRRILERTLLQNLGLPVENRDA